MPVDWSDTHFSTPNKRTTSYPILAFVSFPPKLFSKSASRALSSSSHLSFLLEKLDAYLLDHNRILTQLHDEGAIKDMWNIEVQAIQSLRFYVTGFGMVSISLPTTLGVRYSLFARMARSLPRTFPIRQNGSFPSRTIA
jgi:hypothetical protein